MTDDANPHGIPRPRLPIRSILGRNNPMRFRNNQKDRPVVSTESYSEDSDPTPPHGMPRPK